MAHRCPECGALCHCGGDLDDIEFSDTKEELLCGHCPDPDESDTDWVEEWLDEDWDDDEDEEFDLDDDEYGEWE